MLYATKVLFYINTLVLQYALKYILIVFRGFDMLFLLEALGFFSEGGWPGCFNLVFWYFCWKYCRTIKIKPINT